MQCPRCGTETASGRFCGSCGAPLEVAAAYHQPQQMPPIQPVRAPMPMPPRKKSLTWLWVTLGVVGFLLVAVLLALALGNDGSGADGAMKAYLEARKAGNSAQAYALLSPQARATYTQVDFEAYYERNALGSFGEVEVTESRDPWYQVVVHDLKAGNYTYASAPYTVVKADGKYWIALENPLNGKLDKAYDAKDYPQVLALSDQMLKINPYSYYAYYNRGWAQIEQKQYQPALTSLNEAAKYVVAEDKPDLLRSIGIANGRIGQWEQAAAKLEEARQLGQAMSDLYDAGWWGNLNSHLATAYEQSGKTAKAIDLLEQLYKTDPKGNWARAPAIRLERKAYKVENGLATYKLVSQGITFALPQDWVVSSETTGGDWWFASSPSAPKGVSELSVLFQPQSLGKTMEEAVAGLLKYYQEPIGAPKNTTLTIRQQERVTLDGKPAMAMEFSSGSISLLTKVGENWVDFHWQNTSAAQAALEKWAPTVKFSW